MDPELWEMLEEGDSEDEVAAIIRLGQPGIVPPGVRVIVQFGEIVTVRIIKRGSILDIREEAEVASFKGLGAPVGPDVELDDTELLEGLPEALQPSDERRPPSLDATGRDVVVGIVDWGLDFAHPDFRNPDGSTRILALWDQRGPPRPESPQPYGYGLVHTREEINRALAASDPYAALGYHPADADMGRGSHGTLVAGIAAGNGRSGSPVGIAPEAKIVFVHLTTWGQDGSARLGNSVTLLEAVDFIARTAGERPWVINLSMGRTGEQHDGTTLVEQGLDAVLRAAPGHVTCHSTGNYFTRLQHASGQLRPAEERTLVWEVMKADVTPNELEIWYPGRDKMEVEICSPNGGALVRLKLGERAPLIANGQTVGRAYHRETEPNNLANHIDIFLYAGAPAGAWEVTLSASDVVDGRFHAWIERDAACPDCQSHFRREDADPTSTTGTICNGLRTIAVGAYNPHHPEQPVATFSSMGPTRDGRLKPDLCAPGVGILGARSAPRDADDQAPLWTRMSGTSFAAPHVTGCVALMLQVAPRPLRIEEVHNLLLANTRKVYFPEELPGRVGSGYLDIESAVEAARNIGSIGPELKPASVAQEEAMMREDQEIEISEFVEGKAEDEAEAEEAPNWQNTFHRIASDITGAFEGGKPGTLNLYDLGIISYGKHQATLASGTLYPILKRYTEFSSSETAKKISAYLDRVKQRDETLREGRDFIQLLKDAAKEPEMNRAQDEEFARQYWQPSKKAAREAGIKSALGYVILYDTRVQGGMQQVLKKTQERLGGKVGDTVGTKEITEQEFLRVFVEERVNRNLHISANQKKQADELNKEAQALEDTAAAAPDRAPELRNQAADKRKKAKQYAANASALEISANKTRGPSLRALVDSGDLNLYGDTDGKIYLTGKSGVAITGLKPGATIDSTTPAEQVEEEADEEAIAKRNFILISGGPGPYDNRDIEHDQSWANYVTPVLLLTDKKAKREAFVEEDEEVWWFVYKPAYERRWTEDSSSSLEARKKAVKEVKDRGFTSYVDLIEGRAKERGWNLRWLVEADDLWTKLKTFSKGSISRVWYWGHAREDLWLSVTHDPDTGKAMAPEADEIIKVSSIDSKLKNRFRKGNIDRMNRFIGCNTVKFAEAWAKTFDVWAEGVEGKVNFASIHKTGGEPCLVDSAQVKFYSPGGKEDPGEAWRAKAITCGTIRFESSDSEFDNSAVVSSEDTETAEEELHDDDKELASEVHDQQFFEGGAGRATYSNAEHEFECELVRFAVEIISDGIVHSPGGLLSELLSKAGLMPPARPLGAGHANPTSPATLFDAITSNKLPGLREYFTQFFEIVALPRSRIDNDLHPGDLLVRRALGEGNLAHLAMLVTGKIIRADELGSMRLRPESRRPGLYSEVIDAGPFPHHHEDKFARRLGDENGQLSHDSLILRIRHETKNSPRPLSPTLEEQGTAASAFRMPISTGSLPFLLAGPIVRRATPERVWFWFACSREPKGCQPSITAYDEKGHVWQHLVDPSFKEIVLRVEADRVARLGDNIWIVLCSAVPKSGKFPTDVILGYELNIATEENGNIKWTKLADLDLDITYAPFSRPTFVIGELNRRLAHGSCRRPGASGEDASRVFDEWLAKTAADAFKRPASLILTGDQIYADDVAVPLFEAVHKIAKDVFGYTERIPRESGQGLASVDSYSWKNAKHPAQEPPGTGAGSHAPVPSETDLWSGRKKLTHRITSPIGFTTEDGEAHLLSFPEYAAMYLAVWNPEICKSYGVDNGSDKSLKGFDSAVKAFRRIMANTATYMLCDDHEITDDWNLDQQWEDTTKKNAMARRIIANGLAAYWAFQAWGNEPDDFDPNIVDSIKKHLEQMRAGNGIPSHMAQKYDETLLDRHWSFMAASNPKALCVDTRTRRETPKGKTAILSGKRVWPFMEKLLRKHGFPRRETLLLVLPTPLLPHRSMMYIQSKEYKWPGDRYEGDFELYGNNPQQRAELILWLQHNFGPSSLVIFSGDVHHGSVVTGRYGYGPSLDKIKAGKADWAIRVVQITSSPIKNVKSEAYEKKRWWTLWQTDAGNVGESLIPQWETQYASTTEKTFIAMQAFTRKLDGELGRKTYVFENHFCVVDMPARPGGYVDILFAGAKDGHLATASISVDTDNDPSKFQIEKILGRELPKGVLFPAFELLEDQVARRSTV